MKPKPSSLLPQHVSQQKPKKPARKFLSIILIGEDFEFSYVHRKRDMSSNGSTSRVSLFTEEELKDILGVKECEGYVKVDCGCTSRMYGDTVGKLRIFESGDLDIVCECYICKHEHRQDIMTPSEFEKHARDTEEHKRWKQHIWVTVGKKKVPLLKTALIKYYNKAERASGLRRGPSARSFHRDEFIRCFKCDKLRRFRLQTEEECRIFHDAIAIKEVWECSYFPLPKISCDEDEERASRRAVRGCPSSAHCKGCTKCVCFGCEMCRFANCNCRDCTDFMNMRMKSMQAEEQ